MQQAVTYAICRQNIAEYLRFRGSDFEGRVRVLINNAILDFLRFREWRRLQASLTAVIPAGGTLDLYAQQNPASPATQLNQFAYEIAVFSGTTELEGVTVKEYVSRSAESVYTFEGDTIKATAGTYTVIFKTPGTPFPFTETNKDTTGPMILRFYSDIIEAMVCMNYLRSIRDDTWQQEQQRVSVMLETAKQEENRANNRQAQKVITRPSMIT